MIYTNNREAVFAHGAVIRECFPELTDQTIKLAEEAMKGMLVLPGTGPELYFVGNPPKWTENPVNDNEYTFHLNRMHHLKTLAEAYGLTGNLTYAQKAIEELSDWIDHVHAPSLYDEQGNLAPLHFDGLSPWRALEVGIRGYRTWPLIIELLADTPCFTEEFQQKLYQSVQLHCKILYEISPLLWPKADHNHYLMENLGLMALSCLFPEMPDSAKYLSHSQQELDRCMEAQCTPCGGQIEGSPSYHNGCVFWFSLRLVFARKFHLTVPEHYTKQLKKMFIHSVHATRACGGNFPWGDSHIAEKETMALAATACYMAFEDPFYLRTALYFYPPKTLMNDIRDNLWRIPDIRHLKEIMDDAVTAPIRPDLPLLVWQKDLNQVYLRTGWDKEAISLMTACRTPVQNLHAHIDAGGFDLTAFGETLVTDPAIYTYKDDENRRHFKSAFWHNCLTVNWKNMWEYKGSWAYGPQKEGYVRSVTANDRMTAIISFHKNYEPAETTRILALIDQQFVIVIDQVTGLVSGDSVQIHYHLDRTQVSQTSHGWITKKEGHPNIELAVSPSMVPQLEVGKISTANDVWHDSLLLHLEHTQRANQTFYHGTILIPHTVEDCAAGCTAYTSGLSSEGFFMDFSIHQKNFHLVWDGTTLHLD